VQPVIDIIPTWKEPTWAALRAPWKRLWLAMKPQRTCPAARISSSRAERTMYRSYVGLLSGLVVSIVLVYLLIVVNFQSWLDPFLIISALPAALAGIVWFLFLTNTRLSVPALTGAIMCMAWPRPTPSWL